MCKIVFLCKIPLIWIGSAFFMYLLLQIFPWLVKRRKLIDALTILRDSYCKFKFVVELETELSIINHVLVLYDLSNVTLFYYLFDQ